MRLNDLAGRRVLVAGLGREGRAMLDVLRSLSPFAIGVADRDAGAAEQLPAWAAGAVRVHAPSPDMEEAAGYDVVIKSPGVPPRTKGIVDAAAAGVVVTSPTALWFEETAGHTVIGVTGTKGKSTTATLIHRFLAAAGANAHLLGNIGRPAISLLPADAGKNPVFVVELSSFQLRDVERSPAVAVLLNLFTDHLDWHDGRADYVDSKLNLCRFQGTGDTLIHHGSDPSIETNRLPGGGRRVPYAVEGAIHAGDGWFLDGGTKLFPIDRCRLLGSHNRDNVCAALAAVSVLAYDPARFGESLATFPGLPHRLETAGEAGGVLYVNDSIATGPDAAIRALDAYGDRPKVVLLGGKDKGVPLETLAGRLAERDVKAVVLMGDVGERLRPLLPATVTAHFAADLADAVSRAAAIAGRGDVVLLTPAAASPAPFRDFAERGDRFRELVLSLEKPSA